MMQAEHMVEETVEYLPRKEMHEKYMHIFERYAKVYQGSKTARVNGRLLP